MIIAIDFDGTIVEDAYPDIGKVNEDAIFVIKNWIASGHECILWTCRTGQDLDDAIEFLKNKGIEFSAINDNIPRLRSKFSGRKIVADWYIDDHNAASVSTEQFWKLNRDRLSALKADSDRSKV